MVAGIAETEFGPEPDETGTGPEHAAWLDARGTTLAAATVDLGGAWPGAAAAAGLVTGVRLRLTDRYLIADELRSRGFGIPLAAIEHASLLRRADGDLAAIGFRLRDDAGNRRLWAWEAGGDRFRALHALAAVGSGLGAAGVASADGLLPSLPTEPVGVGATLPGPVVWEGPASVWSNPLTTPRRTTLRLTADAFLWDGPGESLLRLPLATVRAAHPLDGGTERTAGLLLAVGGKAGPADLLVRFAADPGTDRHLRRLESLTRELRSLGLPVVAVPTPAPAQPWLAPTLPAPRLWVVEPVAAAPSAVPDVQPFGRGTNPDPDAPELAAELPVAPDLTLRRVARYEAGALAVLAAIRRGERGAARRLIGESLAAALAELEEAAAAGLLAPTQAGLRRDRLMALNDAAVRFRALAELRAAGLVDDADYAVKRGQVLLPLQERIFAAG